MCAPRVALEAGGPVVAWGDRTARTAIAVDAGYDGDGLGANDSSANSYETRMRR
jgi:hypothetical protein